MPFGAYPLPTLLGNHLKIFIILIFVFSLAMAENDYSVRIGYGKVTSSDLGEILVGKIEEDKHDLRVYAIDAGYRIYRQFEDMPIDIYLKGGFYYYDEDAQHDNIIETTLYLKAYWNIDIWQNRFRVGFGDGISYTDGILLTEYLEALSNKDNNSKILNYIDLSFDVDIGRLIRYEPLYNTALGWVIKHRSGIFGSINNVRKGGSNYNTVYLSVNF